MIFREVKVRSIGGGLDVDDLASNQHDSIPATATPLLRWLSTKHNLIDLAKKVFPASESKNTSKKVEIRNLKLQIWMKRITRGVQALDSKGLIDTVEKSKNRSPGSMYKDLSPQIQRCAVCFSKENTAATNYMMVGACITP